MRFIPPASQDVLTNEKRVVDAAVFRCRQPSIGTATDHGWD
jgi:hypothetical protein